MSSRAQKAKLICEVKLTAFSVEYIAKMWSWALDGQLFNSADKFLALRTSQAEVA